MFGYRTEGNEALVGGHLVQATTDVFNKIQYSAVLDILILKKYVLIIYIHILGVKQSMFGHLENFWGSK